MKVTNEYEAFTVEALEEISPMEKLFEELVEKHPECSIHELEALVCSCIHTTACEKRIRKGLNMRRNERVKR